MTLARERVLITGGTRGLGLGVVEALVERHVKVTILARDSARLRELESQLGLSIISGDATDPKLAESALHEVRPSVLILNAGATPTMAPLHEQTWESFRTNWDTDVKATFHWVQAALRLPLERGGRVLLSSSGAAIDGSPLSGSYAGAKRMIWLMAGYANGIANELNLGIRFQTLLVRQIVGATELGRTAAESYARRKGVSTDTFLAGFGKALSPRDYGEHVMNLLVDPKYDSGTAFAIVAKPVFSRSRHNLLRYAMSTRLHRRADDYVKALPVVCRYTVSRNVKPVRGAEIDWDDKATLQSPFQSLGDKEQQCINGRRLSSASQ